MTSNNQDAISARAYQIWESEGRPHGRHHEHWHQAVRELGGNAGSATSPVGMMGDGTEEQNLNQPGNPAARITQEEVEDAFREAPKK